MAGKVNKFGGGDSGGSVTYFEGKEITKKCEDISHLTTNQKRL